MSVTVPLTIAEFTDAKRVSFRKGVLSLALSRSLSLSLSLSLSIALYISLSLSLSIALSLLPSDTKVQFQKCEGSGRKRVFGSIGSPVLSGVA